MRKTLDTTWTPPAEQALDIYLIQRQIAFFGGGDGLAGITVLFDRFLH